MLIPLGVVVAALVLGVAAYVLTFPLRLLAQAVSPIPGVGPLLANAILAAEDAVINAIRGAFEAVRDALTGWIVDAYDVARWFLDALGGFSVELGEWLYWLWREGIPALARAVGREVADLAGMAWAYVNWAIARLDDLLDYLNRLRDWLLGELYRLAVWPLRELLSTVIPWIVDKLDWLAGEVWHYLLRGLAEALFRIGQAEDWLNREGAWLVQEVASKLNPVQVLEWVIEGLWALVPRDLQLFLRWLWSLLVGLGELLAVLVDPDRWGPLDLDSAGRILDEVARFGDRIEAAIRDEAGLG